MKSLALASAFVVATEAQYYCWPCAARYGTVGKYSSAASEAPDCYEWFLTYLNNVRNGSSNKGDGTVTTQQGPYQIIEALDWLTPPNVMAMEMNECGLSLGNKQMGVTSPTNETEALVAKGLRLKTDQLHQCPCATTGRAHIVKAASDPAIKDIAARESEWNSMEPDYIKKVLQLANNKKSWYDGAQPPLLSGDEINALSQNNVFGMHTVYSPYHSSGPCTLKEVEVGIAGAWSRNFSKGYVPLMDNNLLLYTASLAPLLDAFHRDGVEFYPMRWSAGGNSVYSVMASPCGKVLIEVVASDIGNYPPEHFNQMSHARAIFSPGKWNQGTGDQILAPLRVSRAVGFDKLNETLKFYGVGHDSGELGFHTEVLKDETDASGNRAVTLMLSQNATVHMQLFARHEEEPSSGPPVPAAEDFWKASEINQINTNRSNRAGFCATGSWTVKRYTDYILDVHESVMTPPPPAASDSNDLDMTPPVGHLMDVFVDDHISWDCTSPYCNVAAGGSMLHRLGSRIQWTNDASTDPVQTFNGWTPYSYDPSGYGIQLHWVNTPDDFKPVGIPKPNSFKAYGQNSTCPGSYSGAAPSPPGPEPGPSPGPADKPISGIIIGAIIAGVLVLVAIGAAACYVYKSRAAAEGAFPLAQQRAPLQQGEAVSMQPQDMTVNPMT